MKSNEERDELHRKIWKIANDLRNHVDSWEFKQYVLGSLFYRFISENFATYMSGGKDASIYANMNDKDIDDEIVKDAVLTKGYFIYPSQLFCNVVATASKNENLNTDLKNIFTKIEKSAEGRASEANIKGLFDDFDVTKNLGDGDVTSINNHLVKLLNSIASVNLGSFKDHKIDLFGDAYEFLISNYAANAGKSGGEFFTPQQVSKLIAKIATYGQTRVNKIYDPACGSGSLLLQAQKLFSDNFSEEGYFGQELNKTTYNLARMNMFLHNVNYDKFKIKNGDTLFAPYFKEDKPFDAIVSNPPYSKKWDTDSNPTLINDERFAPAGVLAPKGKSDFAFVLHSLNYLSSKGRAAIVCFPGIFYRGGAEQKIRQYLIDNNFIETIISLAGNMFYGTSIAVTILVLAKNKPNNLVQFIDASSLFQKATNNNILLDEHIDKIMEVFASKENIEYFATSVDTDTIYKNDYNLAVSSYITPEDKSEIIDIDALNIEIENTVEKVNKLRAEIKNIIADIKHEE